ARTACTAARRVRPMVAAGPRGVPRAYDLVVALSPEFARRPDRHGPWCRESGAVSRPSPVRVRSRPAGTQQAPRAAREGRAAPVGDHGPAAHGGAAPQVRLPGAGRPGVL